MGNKTKIFKGVAWFASVYHALLGLGGLFGSSAFIQQVVKGVYGINLTLTSEVIFLIKFTSVYMLAFAVAMAIMALNPVRHGCLIWVAAALFGTRILYKIIFFQDIQTTFGGAATGEITTLVVITAMLGLLFWSRPKGQG